VANPPKRAKRRPGGPGGGGGRIDPIRALIVLALFILATVLLLGSIHPTTSTATAGAAGAAGSSGSSGGTTPSTTTTTTRPVPTTTTIPAARVPVMVANATSVPGAAGAVRSKLVPGGWDLLPPVDATAHLPASSVYYLAGFEPQAKSIAASLGLPATAVLPYTTAAPISSIGAAQVLVMVGPALASAATASTTPTTAAG